MIYFFCSYNPTWRIFYAWPEQDNIHGSGKHSEEAQLAELRALAASKCGGNSHGSSHQKRKKLEDFKQLVKDCDYGAGKLTRLIDRTTGLMTGKDKTGEGVVKVGTVSFFSTKSITVLETVL